VVQRLHDAFAKAMQSERHLQELARYDQTLDYLNTRDYRQAVLETVEREKRLLQRMNLLAKPPGA
jgi:tripartite-type tricarboxylate transporter receptor subunit TctC